jgi:hypothetical protein
MMETYAEYGAIGVIVSLFVMMIMNLENVEGIVLKMLDRWNKSDDISQRHREDIVRELNDVTDDLAYLKGRINGKNA